MFIGKIFSSFQVGEIESLILGISELKSAPTHCPRILGMAENNCVGCLEKKSVFVSVLRICATKATGTSDEMSNRNGQAFADSMAVFFKTVCCVTKHNPKLQTFCQTEVDLH